LLGNTHKVVFLKINFVEWARAYAKWLDEPERSGGSAGHFVYAWVRRSLAVWT